MRTVESSEDLRRWIQENMTTDPAGVINEERGRASKFVSVAKDGSVVVKAQERFTARHRTLAVFVGKLYAEAAGYSSDAVVTNPELAATLNLPDGTIRPIVKGLRDNRLVESLENGRHVLLRSSFRRALDELESVTRRKL